MNELIRIHGEQLPSTMEESIEMLTAMRDELNQMRGMLQVMADMIRVNNEQMQTMTRTVQALTMRSPVTRVQANALNAAMKDRASGLAAEWGYPAAAKGVLKSIRSDVKKALESGAGVRIRSMADVPACQYKVIMDLIGSWDDITVRRKARRGEL